MVHTGVGVGRHHPIMSVTTKNTVPEAKSQRKTGSGPLPVLVLSFSLSWRNSGTTFLQVPQVSPVATSKLQRPVDGVMAYQADDQKQGNHDHSDPYLPSSLVMCIGNFSEKGTSDSRLAPSTQRTKSANHKSLGERIFLLPRWERNNSYSKIL